MQNLLKRLEKKGWSGKEIKKAADIIENTNHSKSHANIFLEKKIYWILLIVIAAANFAVSIALIPLFITLKGMFLYFVLTLLGIIFGLLFELVIRSIEHLERRHHLILAVLIPLAALANIFIVSKISNNLARTLQLANFQNPILISIVYSVSFVLPYIIYRFVLKMEYYAKE